MKNALMFPVGCTQALEYAGKLLSRKGFSLADHPSPEVTHLLLDVPSFGSDGNLRCGTDPERVLERLPPEITVIGGNLQHPALEGYKTVDLLRDQRYLARNAWITAECALQLAAPRMGSTFRDSPVLVIGWGRIGKCLGKLLQSFGCDVTVAARKEQDRAILEALGYHAVDTVALEVCLPEWRLVFNTVPHPIAAGIAQAGPDCVWIDLASKKGLEAENVIWARGLPGKYAPESSGKLIAETVMRFYKEAQL